MPVVLHFWVSLLRMWAPHFAPAESPASKQLSENPSWFRIGKRASASSIMFPFFPGWSPDWPQKAAPVSGYRPLWIRTHGADQIAGLKDSAPKVCKPATCPLWERENGTSPFPPWRAHYALKTSLDPPCIFSGHLGTLLGIYECRECCSHSAFSFRFISQELFMVWCLLFFSHAEMLVASYREEHS